ncbi:hypothetical protein JD844_002072 [Phrynosoma platyrhinos]|uniref:Huntingtin-associated protein 1 n=1 Tax=Phrynosoma platyrhinos TaxID=52577 RepID=A0ABQ7TAY3_PHRPL|nr:hypothetical protein JD844_002072 [Phrynosoma platyrhinos]
MFPSEAGELLGSQGMEFWTSPASYDEVNGNTELDDNTDLISQELEEGWKVEESTKEHDLELAARIGQSLLKQNRSLSERNELLEEQLELAKEEIAQLRHEISMRDDLLHLYTNSTEESEPVSTISTPLRRNESALSLQQYFQYDALQQKLKGLEEENQKLRTEVTSIATETCQYEEQEQKLMIDCVEQFSDASREVVMLSEELARKTEDTSRQQEEISQLLAQIVDLQQKCRTYGSEVEELQQHLTAAKEVQQHLRGELQDLQEKYAECGAMLHEAQEEIKNLRNRSLPNSTIHRHSSPTFLPLDSLAAEIKGTMRKGMDSSGSSEYNRVEVGTPGTPGRHDLEAALQCLSARQENHSTDRSFFEVEREHKLRRLARDVEDSSGFLTPNESITSTGTNYSGSSGGSGFSLGSFSYFPDKLQIIKPLEDFRQLDTDLEEVYSLNDLEEDDVDVSSFSALATSTPAKAKERPSVFQSVNNLPQTPPTFTITTCCILHPSNEVTMVTPSLYNTVVPSCGPSEGLSPPIPPKLPLQEQHSQEKEEEGQRRWQQLAYSPLGLVSLLTARGISAWGRAEAALPHFAGGLSAPYWLSPSLVPLWRCRWDGLAECALGARPLRRRKPEKGRNSIFSLNLVEKLQQLGLDKVVARGEATYATSQLQGFHRGKGASPDSTGSVALP